MAEIYTWNLLLISKMLGWNLLWCLGRNISLIFLSSFIVIFYLNEKSIFSFYSRLINSLCDKAFLRRTSVYRKRSFSFSLKLQPISRKKSGLDVKTLDKYVNMWRLFQVWNEHSNVILLALLYIFEQILHIITTSLNVDFEPVLFH